MNEASLWSFEERLWLEGADAFEDLLHPECVMAFPGVGLMFGQAILDSIRDAPRWSRVEMDLRQVGRAGPDAVVLGYRAAGFRDRSDPYRCYCTSTYRRDAQGWRIIQHQQTPAEPTAPGAA